MEEFDSMVDVLMSDARFKAEYQRQMLYQFITGEQGFGKGMSAKKKQMWMYFDSVPRNSSAGRLGMPKPDARTELPPKVCNYRKPKLYWFGELHGSNNFVWNDGFTMVRHWKVSPTTLTIKGRDPADGLSIWPAAPLGSTTGRSPFQGKRFIGISEPDEQHWDSVDDDFLKRISGDTFVTKTYNRRAESWSPQGEIFVTSGKPLKMRGEDGDFDSAPDSDSVPSGG